MWYRSTLYVQIAYAFYRTAFEGARSFHTAYPVFISRINVCRQNNNQSVAISTRAVQI